MNDSTVRAIQRSGENNCERSANKKKVDQTRNDVTYILALFDCLNLRCLKSANRMIGRVRTASVPVSVN